MRPIAWRKLDLFARHLVPAVSTFGLLLVGIIPLHLPSFPPVAPALPLIAVFYWTLYRPDLMPPWAVFLLGLLQDILFATPIGVGACVLVIVHAAVSAQRRFFIGKSFGILWLGFALVVALALPVSWLLSCIYYGRLARPDALAFQVLTTVGVFPAMCWLLLRCQLSLLRQT